MNKPTLTAFNMFADTALSGNWMSRSTLSDGRAIEVDTGISIALPIPFREALACAVASWGPVRRAAPLSLNEALEQLALSSVPAPWLGRRQLIFCGTPFGRPVTAAEAWELIRLLRVGYAPTEHTLALAALGATREDA
jgi:hypothetical protein